ncbi:hypothetical protein FQR65_LT17560 [Abscondita terminalis]|nr:hypothetical protein FQR65_LT17560 [Abscondita terminalis]
MDDVPIQKNYELEICINSPSRPVATDEKVLKDDVDLNKIYEFESDISINSTSPSVPDDEEVPITSTPVKEISHDCHQLEVSEISKVHIISNVLIRSASSNSGNVPHIML